MKMGNEVKGASPLGGYRLRVVFTDGFTGEVDLGPLFAEPRGPMTEPFGDSEFFAQVRVDPELGVPSWPNGYDICADVLRYYCELGRVCSREELQAAFNPQPASQSASALNDKPKP